MTQVVETIFPTNSLKPVTFLDKAGQVRRSDH